MLRGLATLVFLFPRWNQSERHATVQRWAQGVLASAAVKLHCSGMPGQLPGKCLVVLNHVSWLDILIMAAVQPVTFIAKAEISRWPLVGTLVTRAGTLYIERGSFRALRHVNQRLAAALRSGMIIACFPEGTTSIGHGVARFHAGLFQPAIEAEAVVQPVALRYRDGQGHINEASAYINDDTLMQSIWRVVSTPEIHAELHFLPQIQALGGKRRSIAERAQAGIAATVAGP